MVSRNNSTFTNKTHRNNKVIIIFKFKQISITKNFAYDSAAFTLSKIIPLVQIIMIKRTETIIWVTTTNEKVKLNEIYGC